MGPVCVRAVSGGIGVRRTNGRANNVDETGLKRKTRWKKKKLETQLWVRAPSVAAVADAVAAQLQLQPLLIVSFLLSVFVVIVRAIGGTWVGRLSGWGWAVAFGFSIY